jgi:hypothetical protein
MPRNPASAPANEAETPKLEIVTETPAAPQKPYDVDDMIYDWMTFARSALVREAKYEDIPELVLREGWLYRIKETYVGVYDQSITVEFSLLVGRRNAPMTHLDGFTIQVPRNAVAPSMAARGMAEASAIYVALGRLPPAPPVVQEAPPAVVERPQPEPEPEPVEEWAKPAAKSGPMPIPGTYTPDGILVMENPYEISGDPDDIIEGLLERFEEAVGRVEDPSLLSVLWKKNTEAVEFIKYFGGQSDKEKLASTFSDRVGALSGAKLKN